MEKDSKKRLFEVMGRLDKTFKPKLNEDIEQPQTDVNVGTDNEPNITERYYNNQNNNNFSNRRRNDDDEDDQDAGHTVNGKLLTPDEYRKWKDEEGEFDDMDRERYPRRR